MTMSWNRRALLFLLLVAFTPAEALFAQRPPLNVSVTTNCPSGRCVAGETVVFTAELIHYIPFGFGITRYPVEPTDEIIWNFGDGTTIKTTGETRVTHQYAAAGQFETAFTLRARDLEEDGHGGWGIHIVPGPPVYVRFSQPEFRVREGEGPVTVSVVRSGDLSRPLTMQHVTANGPTQTRGTLTFAPGETTRSFSVPIENDNVYRSRQRVFVRLESAEVIFPLASYGAAENYGAFINIEDDDPAPQLSISDTRVVEGDNGIRVAVFDVRLSYPLPIAAQAGFSLSGGTARMHSDYQPASFSVHFAPGQTSAPIAVLIVGDETPEPDEYFTVRMNDTIGVPYVLQRAEARGVIVNDDESFVDTDLRAPAGTQPMLTLRTGESKQPQIIPLSSSDPSVVAVPDSITVAPGEILTSFAVDAKAAGWATVHAGTATATVQVFNLVVPSFAVSSLRMAAGRTETVTIVTTPARGTPLVATVTSSDPSVATVMSPVEISSGSGTLSIAALKEGRTTITATLPASLGGMSATMEIVVEGVSQRRRPR